MNGSAMENPVRSMLRSADGHPKGLDLLYFRSARYWSNYLHGQESPQRVAEQAEKFRDSYALLTEHDLDQMNETIRISLRREGVESGVLPQAIALLREVAHRELGLLAYPVQLQGIAAIMHGKVAEMGTGEGKTLTIAIAAILRVWRDRMCHVFTANDYLAERDAGWVSSLCERCGVSVGTVIAATDDGGRRRAYRSDLVYTTPREAAADYLRDRLDGLTDQTPPRRLSRGMRAAIVDEADAVLIDEAVTPLILSVRSDYAFDEAAHEHAHRIAGGLSEGTDYVVDRSARDVELRTPGENAIREAGGRVGPGDGVGVRRIEELVVAMLVAEHCYVPGRDYLVREERITIIDPSTGRLMADRTYRAGLQQALEMKHGLAVRPPQESLASISFQRFFGKYRSLAGASGTAREVVGELWEIYALRVAQIPSNRAKRLETMPSRLYRSKQEKIDSIAAEAEAYAARGRAVLIGCQSVNESEAIAATLLEKGAECLVLNAQHHRAESEIIGRAGQTGAITIATNMAGRGTDIVLDERVRSLGGLHVILAEPQRSGRLHRQLEGRCARQGDPGSRRLYIAADDDLLDRELPGVVLQLPRVILPLLVWIAQVLATRKDRQRRRDVLRHDEKTDELLGFAGAPM